MSKTSRPTPTTLLPLTRLHVLKDPQPPKTSLPDGEKVFKRMSLGGHFTFSSQLMAPDNC